ncbi:MAG TPA: hypothetical protein VFS43_21710 [Polyangiaceae bacterium]|nr:hypothetical protein [Polyangiaceae bacterium]
MSRAELTRDAPIPKEWTVREARDAYLAENQFTLEAYDAPRTGAAFLGFAFSVPNPPKHRWGIMLHDLHHVATGYGTDVAGEGEVSAWELRRGLRNLGLYVGSLVVLGTMAGLMRAPLRTLRAFLASGGGRGSLFADVDERAYDELLALSVGELRARLGIPEGGLSRHRRGLHSLVREGGAPGQVEAGGDPLRPLASG